MSTDFRIIPLIKRYSTFYEEDVYVIPCKVLEIGNLIIGRTYEIKIKILDFYTAKLIESSGITYKGSLQYFPEPPFINECIVRKSGIWHFDLIVYNRTTPGVLERLFGVKKILNNDEDEIMEIYNHHYSKFRDWLGGNTKKPPPPDNNDDLPF